MIFNKSVIYADASRNVLLRRESSVIPGGEREIKRHQHTEFELALIKEGSGTYNIKGKAYDFSEGDIFIISSNEIHCITYINPCTTFHLMNIQFEPRFIWSAENTWFDAELLKIFFERNEIFENKLSKENPATDIIRGLLLEMEEEADKKHEQYRLMVKLLLIKVLLTIMRSYDYVKNSGKSFSFKEQTLESVGKALDFINSNLENSFTLDDLARVANMNRSYFCTVFKKLNGIAPWDYITIKRVERAIELLKESDTTMLEIACRCGFNNTANFNRAFKKVTGQVPKSYHNKEALNPSSFNKTRYR